MAGDDQRILSKDTALNAGEMVPATIPEMEVVNDAKVCRSPCSQNLANPSGSGLAA